MRTPMIAAAMAALALVPAAAIAQGDDPISTPLSQQTAMRLAVSVKLTTGGSVVSMTVRPTGAGGRDFADWVYVVACAGETGCKTARINPDAKSVRARFNFDLDDTASAPVKVQTQVVACTVGFRCASFNKMLRAS